MTQNQTNNYDSSDLSRHIESIELESSNESDEISDDLERSNMQWIVRNQYEKDNYIKTDVISLYQFLSNLRTAFSNETAMKDWLKNKSFI